MPGPGKPFVPGDKRAGRPPGSRDKYPRDFVKRLLLGVMEQHKDLVEKTIRDALSNPKTVAQLLETAGRLNRELGQGVDTAGPRSIVVIVKRENGACTDRRVPSARSRAGRPHRGHRRAGPAHAASGRHRRRGDGRDRRAGPRRAARSTATPAHRGRGPRPAGAHPAAPAATAQPLTDPKSPSSRPTS
jgi:hypothetical protein